MGTGPAIELPLPGATLNGKYEIVGVIGEGGMARVFEAKHMRLSQRVAIKMLLPDMLAVPEIVTRFAREARAAGCLRSRHAARILDVDESDGVPYMVMEFLEGSDLSAELEERGRLPIEEAVLHILQACAAMTEAHVQGIVHRDLKPSNLFLCTEEMDGSATEPGQRVLKVLDFGISKMSTEGDASVTATSATIGTPLYMSPEQVRSSKNVDARTDIWSLGIILYELLSGRTPFEGNSSAAIAAIMVDEPPPLRALRPEVPSELAKIIEIALSKKPEGRYADVEAFAAALAPYGPPGRISERFMAVAVRRASSDGMRAVVPPSAPTPLESAPTLPDSQKDVAAVAATLPDDAAGLGKAVHDDDALTSPYVTSPKKRSGGARRAVVAGIAVMLAGGVATVFFVTRTSAGPSPAGDVRASAVEQPPPPSALPLPVAVPPASSQPLALVAPASAAPPSIKSSAPPRPASAVPVKPAAATPPKIDPVPVPTAAPAVTKNPDKL